MVSLLLVISTLVALNKNLLSETESQWHLNNGTIEVIISKTDGEIAAIIMKNQTLISSPCSVGISGGLKKDNGELTEKNIVDQSPHYAQVDIKKTYPDIVLEYTYTINSSALHWAVTAIGKSGEEQEIGIAFSIPLIKSMQYMFYAAEDAPTSLKNINAKRIFYRRNTFIPITTFYNVTEDYGLSVVAPFELFKPDLLFSIDQNKAAVTYRHLRLTDKEKTQAAIHIVPHEGDWRPGLAYLLDKYPEYFYPGVENTKHGEGWYAQGSVYDKEEKITRAASRGVKWSEFHYYFPFYGLYIPKMQNWGLIADSDEISLRDWEKGAGEKRNSYEHMHSLIELWHKYSIQVYLYFQVFEAWHQYAEEYFNEDIALRKNGNPHSSWKFTNLMNPDPLGNWGKYVVDQTKKLIKEYPEIDGIFYDRMDYWTDDFAQDDGITMIDSNPVYMLGFALQKTNDKIFDILHRNQKGIWGNGPTSIEVCKNLDGIMAEASPLTLQKIQYLGLARPLVFLPYDRNPEDTERKLKNALVCGAFPSITYGNKKCLQLDEKYSPLFDLTKNRKWILTKNPIEFPEVYKGNIFQTPDGNYVVTIISPEKSQLIPHLFEYNIPVIVNIPDADEIEAAYLLSGDWYGFNIIDFKENNKVLKINLPYHLSTSLIYLTKKRKFNVARYTSPILIKGRNENIAFHINNLETEGIGTLTLETPWYRETKQITSDIVKFYTKIPEDRDGEVEISVDYNGEKHKMSCWIVDPVSITAKEDIFIMFSEGDSISFYITNNLDRQHSIEIKGKYSEGSGTITVPKRLLLRPLESRLLKLHTVSKTPGTIQLTIISQKKEFRKLFPVKVALSFDKNDLFHDSFEDEMKKWNVQRGEWIVSKGIAQGSGSSHFAFIKNNAWQNYMFEVKTKIQGSDNPVVDWLKSYIFFRLQDENNFYRFGIHGDNGEIDLYKRVNGKYTRLGTSLFRPQKNKWYALRVSVQGSKIIGYINGAQVIEADDNTFVSGGIGIGVLEDGMRCCYSDVIVKKLQ